MQLKWGTRTISYNSMIRFISVNTDDWTAFSITELTLQHSSNVLIVLRVPEHSDSSGYPWRSNQSKNHHQYTFSRIWWRGGEGVEPPLSKSVWHYQDRGVGVRWPPTLKGKVRLQVSSPCLCIDYQYQNEYTEFLQFQFDMTGPHNTNWTW